MKPSRFTEEQIIGPARVALYRSRKTDPERLHRELNARLRDESLNETLFTSLVQVRAVLIAWKNDYNDVRPHSALGNLTPTEYADRSAPGATGRSAALH